MSNKKKTVLKVISIFLVVICFSACAVFFHTYYERKNQENVSDEIPSQADDTTVYYEGEAYRYNVNIKNILFLGIDNDSEMKESDMLGTAGQADSIILLSINKEENTTQLLQISRDAMTDVDLYDVNGEKYSSMKAQIATQYAYGDGKDGSCRAMKKTVEELLYELPIYGYVAVDIAAISVLNDMLGGVKITIPEDYTEIDPAFVKGATLTLDGEQAEKYVRYRDTMMLGSNNLRMERQMQYITALFETFQSKGGAIEENFDAFYSALSSYFVSDLTADEMKEMMKYEWDAKKVTYLPGESVAGKEHEEFLVDEDALQKILIELFYEPK